MMFTRGINQPWRISTASSEGGGERMRGGGYGTTVLHAKDRSTRVLAHQMRNSNCYYLAFIEEYEKVKARLRGLGKIKIRRYVHEFILDSQ
jgi:hypothetical protein